MKPDRWISHLIALQECDLHAHSAHCWQIQRQRRASSIAHLRRSKHTTWSVQTIRCNEIINESHGGWQFIIIL